MVQWIAVVNNINKIEQLTAALKYKEVKKSDFFYSKYKTLVICIDLGMSVQAWGF